MLGDDIKGYRSCAWNMRGLLHGNRLTRQNKIRFLRQFLPHYDTFCVLEAHVISGQFEAFSKQFGNIFEIFYSSGTSVDRISGVREDDKGTGGIIIFVRKTSFLGWRMHFDEIAPGRIVVFKAVKFVMGPDGVEAEDKVFIHSFVHNAALERSHMMKFYKFMDEMIDIVETNPYFMAMVLSGDVNIRPEFEVPTSLDKPEEIVVRNLETALPPRACSGRPFQSWWNKLFSRMLEVEIQGESHVNLAALSMSTLDRVWIKVARSVVPLALIEGQIHSSPMRWTSLGVSDHSPVSFRIAPRKSKRLLPHRIPGFVCKHEMFNETIENYFNIAELDKTDIQVAIVTAKELIHQAAKVTREFILHNDKDTLFSKLNALTGIAKAVWGDNWLVARKLYDETDLGTIHLNLKEQRVKLTDAKAFEMEFLQAKKDHLDKEHKDTAKLLTTSCSEQKKMWARQKCDKIGALAKLWNFSSPRLILGSVIVDESTQNDTGIPLGHAVGADRITVLAAGWAGTFNHHMNNNTCAETLLKKYKHKVKWDWKCVNAPLPGAAAKFLCKAKRSGPGWDGIPYVAWFCAGPHAHDLIDRLTESQILGEAVPDGYNVGMWVFPPKKPLSTDPANSRVVARLPKDTRPLACKVCDSKAVGALVVDAVTPLLMKNTSSLQRGFVRGRQIAQNILELDTISRVHALREMHSKNQFNLSCMLPHESVSKIALLAFFDFCAAFPSVCHQWIFSVLSAIGAPCGLVNVVKGMYTNVDAFAVNDEQVIFLFKVLSGVLTGCTMSGMLFNFAMDPFLWAVGSWVCNVEIGRALACADDIGAALSQLSYLIKMRGLFKVFELASGLSLHPGKCVLVLTTVAANEHNCNLIRAWLRTNIPDWADFKICNQGQYLGVALGPLSSSQMWAGPIAKYVLRSDEINQCGAPAALSIRQYNSKAVPVLSYVAQFCDPPSSMVHVETAALTKVLRFPTNAFCGRTVQFMRQRLEVNVTSVIDMMHAVKIRAGQKTFFELESWFTWLKSHVHDCLPISAWSSGEMSPPGWDSPGVAVVVHKACQLSDISNDCKSHVYSCIHKWVSGGRKSGLQRDVYSILVGNKDHDWSPLLGRRLSLFGVSPPLPLCDYIRFLRENLIDIPLSRRIVVMRTICNGWSTSSRYPEAVSLPCVFGCNCFHPLIKFHGHWDSVAHYLSCPRLNRLVSDVTNQHNSRLGLTLDTRQPGICRKLCLLQDSSDLWCWIAHGMYHFAKHSRFEKAMSAHKLPVALKLNDECLRYGKYLIDSVTPTPNSTLRTHPPPVSHHIHDTIPLSSLIQIDSGSSVESLSVFARGDI